jgi:hypothetical protein
MTVVEIQELCIKASETYYNYLKEKGLGIVVIEVSSKETVDEYNNIYNLRLAQKIFDLDTVVFIDKTNKMQYDTTEIKIVEYDVERNYLIIKVPKESNFNIRDLDHRDILIVSDLKFLVQRVIDWYKQSGADIKFPVITERNSVPSSFFAEQPNEEQKKAIQNILTSPFSYIWGAPGTGKTQLVLSYAIIQYLERGKNVAILAPTNNAIEQVLRGVIRMTDKKGVDRKQIIRLGSPSKAFAKEYPEVCEAKGILEKIGEIEKQIEIIKKIFKLDEIKENHQKAEIAIKSFLIIEEEIKRKDEIKESIEIAKQKLSIAQNNLQTELGKFQRDINIMKLEYENIEQEVKKLRLEQDHLQKSITSLFHSFKRLFSSSPLTKEENRLTEISKTLLTKQEELKKSNQTIKLTLKEFEESNQIRILKQETQEIEDHHNSLLLEYKNEKLFNKHFEIIKNNIKTDMEICDFILDINIKNALLKKDMVVKFAEKLNTDIAVTAAMAKEYMGIPLNEKLDEFEKEKEFLKYQTTKERLKDVNIIACTLDCYIGRFVDEELPVAHFFLDEAGYACAIKALTMFRSEKPVTFLGDHLQLPPVCQLNDSDLKTTEEYKDVFIWSQSAIFIGDIFKNSKDQAFLDYYNDKEPTFPMVSKSDLKITHRFGENLAKALNLFVYKNGFRSAQIDGTTKVKIIHMANDIPPTNTRENLREAQAIHDFIKSGELGTSDFIVLTPYANQVNLIGKLLRELRKERKILTVHGSQGREWETVILSISDTDNMFFTNSKHKKGRNLINTAVSRAKKELIIVCNHNFWIRENGQLIQSLLQIGTRLN